MSKVVIVFENIEQWEKDNKYEAGVIRQWVEDGNKSAIAEVFDICRASYIKIEEE